MATPLDPKEIVTVQETSRCGKGNMAFGQCILLVLILFAIALQISSCDSRRLQSIPRPDVVLFDSGKYTNIVDIISYEGIARELGLKTRLVDHRFINRRKSFFDKSGKRQFKVLILPGGEPDRWFEKHPDVSSGIKCQGAKNILRFIKSGGSVIAICLCGSILFSREWDWLNPNLYEAQGDYADKWKIEHRNWSGIFVRFCGVGVYAFDGTIRGPQESNRPYPTTRFLPITMNPENEIVREANLPSVIHMMVSGGGSIIPSEGQPLDVVGCYPNGTAAIGIVPYGQGRIILSNPHPNITGEWANRWRFNGVMGPHAMRFGWTDEMIAKGRELVKSDKDPDGPEPDWALAKAMLSYAYRKASE